MYIYMSALPSRSLMEHNKVSTASAYCRKHRHAQHGWSQRWLIVDGISVKSRQDQKKKQRQSTSERIIKKAKGDDAERW